MTVENGFIKCKYTLPDKLELVPQMLDEKPFKKHLIQIAYWNSTARFRVVAAGRRSGKTHIAKKRVIKEVITKGGKYFVAAPTRSQAKMIYWDDLKKMIPKQFIVGKPSETELIIKLHNGSLHVVGLDEPARIEGIPWKGGVLDEYGNMKEDTWFKHVEPALGTMVGWCDLIGTPEGRNHYFRTAIKAASPYNTSWEFFTWESADILPKEVIEDAKVNLDIESFNQEYRGSFGTITGGVYYTFGEHNKAKLSYDKFRDLYFCFDFNVSPGVAAVFQEAVLPNNEFGIKIIDEVYIDKNSNTEKVCKELSSRYYGHSMKVYLCGDATGGARRTSSLQGTDWDIVKDILSPNFDVVDLVPSSNPSERERVNKVNSYLRNAKGVTRLYVDPIKCPMTVVDFEGVVWDKNNTIDKKKDDNLTHLTDAIGYGVLAVSSSNTLFVSRR